MFIMKHLFTTLFALLLSVTVQAQHSQAEDVVPASSGTLPVATIPEAEEGIISCLYLSRTGLASFQGNSWDYEIEFSFPYPGSLGAEYYTLEEKRSSGNWEAKKNNDGTIAHITDNLYYVYCNGGTYRLVLHGGDKDGWVSNEIEVPVISIPTQVGYSHMMNDETFVGSKISSSTITATVYHDINNLRDYTTYRDDPGFVRTWYRRNPNTGELTFTGSHDSSYTVTVDDVGYEILEVVEGDKNIFDFYYSCPRGIGQMKINCSAEFFFEGFIVNCEYDIPNPETFFGIKKYDEEIGGSRVQPFAAEDFKVLAPGRYGIIYPWSEYGFGEEVFSTFNYYGLSEKQGNYYSQFRLWAAPGQLVSEARQNGNVVEGAQIYQLEKNMYGTMQYVCTTSGEMVAPSFINLYAKAVNVGEGNLPTYYPSALLWTDAQSFEIQSMYAGEGPQDINIEVRPAFAPLSGSCTIDGQINGSAPVPVPLFMPEDPDIIGTWTFYMTDEEGNPNRDDIRIQATFNDDNTFVLNIPVWGETQSGTWSWWSTGQSIQLQITKVVDRTGTYEGESLLEHWGVDADDERVKFVTDISFDAKGNLIMDLYGLPGSVYEPEGGVVEPTPDPVYVYLRQKDGDIVAAALMQADGTYRFDKVPYGTYEVIPNIDGYTVDIQSVTLSAENPAAKAGDYTIGDYVITAEGVDGIDQVSTAATVADDVIYDLSGRRVAKGNLSRGLYILNGKKVVRP